VNYSDENRLKKIYENDKALNDYIRDNNINRERLLTEKPLQWLVTTPLYNIGEHVYNLSDELKSDHGEVQWKMISGLRHRLVHDYEGINWNIITDIVFDELPEFIKQIKKIF
jgi:uncharacterized protein with HEPN domain